MTDQVYGHDVIKAEAMGHLHAVARVAQEAVRDQQQQTTRRTVVICATVAWCFFMLALTARFYVDTTERFREVEPGPAGGIQEGLPGGRQGRP